MLRKSHVVVRVKCDRRRIQGNRPPRQGVSALGMRLHTRARAHTHTHTHAYTHSSVHKHKHNTHANTHSSATCFSSRGCRTRCWPRTPASASLGAAGKIIPTLVDNRQTTRVTSIYLFIHSRTPASASLGAVGKIIDNRQTTKVTSIYLFIHS